MTRTHRILERQQLSDGRVVVVQKFPSTPPQYSTYIVPLIVTEPPDYAYEGPSQDEALDAFADILQADVLETDL